MIHPTLEQLSDPYVLQLIEALSKQGDVIEMLQETILDYESRLNKLEEPNE